MATLGDLKPGDAAEVDDFFGDPAVIDRLLAMGLTEGERVEVLRFAPLGDPIEIRVRGYNLSLRRSEARVVLIKSS